MPNITFAMLLLSFAVWTQGALAAPPPLTREQCEEDFDAMWAEIGASYAYFDQKTTDWAKVKALYRPRLQGVATPSAFVELLEQVLDELYDHHAHLNANTASSWRLVPSGADVWAAWRRGAAILIQVRPGSNAERAGLRAGMEVMSIDGIGVREAVDQRVGKALGAPDPAARDWALRVLLAGRHNRPRRLGVRSGDGLRDMVIDDRPSERATAGPPRALLTLKRLGQDGRIGYVRINNSLGALELIREFDAALAELRNSAGLILDLRDTPGGGNTTVARGIMGRFIDREGFYQKHSIPAEERRFGVKRSWVELVSPRGAFRYGAPVVVLVDHWTGSMGEGLALGMDGLKRATIVGTEMAGLLGATHEVVLPNSKIGVSVPAEKLFHVDGTPREHFVPAVYVDLTKPETQETSDAILEVGLKALQALIKSGGMK